MVNVPWVSCTWTFPFQTIEHSFPLTMKDDGGFLRWWKDIQHCAEEGWTEGQEERKGTFPGWDEWPGDRVFSSQTMKLLLYSWAVQASMAFCSYQLMGL